MSTDLPSLTAETLLADAIARDPAVAERLARFHPAFAPLCNAAARATMARLVRLGDAARMAGVSVTELLAVAEGRAVAAAPAPSGVPGAVDGPETADWFAEAEARAEARIDVRPLIAAGTDPFAAIMRIQATVPEGGVLVLDAPFDPAPLRRVLLGKGFTSIGRRLAPDHWRIAFRRDGGRGQEQAPQPAVPRPGARWQEADGLHLDVRGLAPPAPMVLILETIDAGTVDRFIVHHERDPVFLYPELAERGWRCHPIPGEAGEVRLELRREG